MSGRRSCPGGGKVRYHDKKQALRAMRYVQAKSTRERVACRVYFCGACRGWHLTSRPD